MKFEVIKIEKTIVTKQGPNLNQEYAKLTVMSPDSGEIREVPVFDIEAKAYLSYLGKESELPEALKINKWKYCFDEEYVFPGNKPMVRVNEAGQPEVNKFGQMYQRTSVTVMVRCHRDDDYAMLHPEKNYPNGICILPDKGWDVSSRGTSVMNAFYVPLESIVPQGAASPAPVQAPGIAQAPGTAQGAAPAPGVAPVQSPV